MIRNRGPARRIIRKRRNNSWLALVFCIVLWGVVTKAPMMIPGEPTRFNAPGPVQVLVHQPTDLWTPPPLAPATPVVVTVETDEPVP